MYFDARDFNLRQADIASAKALELEPELAEAHVARGLAVSLSKRFAEAEAEFEKAMRLDPKLFEAALVWKSPHVRGTFRRGGEDVREGFVASARGLPGAELSRAGI
jgi:tetratricopeptide (TPR) repeat protein